MALKEDFSSLRQRLSDIAARFDRTFHREPESRSSDKGKFRPSIFQSLRELFTQGVTFDELRDLVGRDARETLRYYIREIDFESLRSKPWYRRYPAIAWKVFIALAYRLSPPRRLAFAAAIFLWVIGWIELIIFAARGPADQDSGIVWLSLSFAAILFLLLMELRDKLDLKGDLEIAREIQFGLIPSSPFHQNGTHIHCSMRPANTVGGDYCDIIQLAENQVGIVVGDVAGKGMPAALLMALLQGSLRTLITAGHRGPELMDKLNVYLCENIPDNKLVTLFYGELDTVTGRLQYVNAGHNPPLLLRNGATFDRLPATSLVMGIDRNCQFEARDAEIRPGDKLLVYTDGVTEAFNLKEEEYGEPRLTAFLQQNPDTPPDELIKGLVADVLSFCGPVRLNDDMTLMAVTREC